MDKYFAYATTEQGGRLDIGYSKSISGCENLAKKLVSSGWTVHIMDTTTNTEVKTYLVS